jgi:putative FmdB family regulatory protein
MPLYEYVCPEDKQRFEKLRPMSEGASATCPTCGSTSPRVISMMAARVAVGVGADSYASAPSASASCSCGGAGCC